MAVFGPFQVTFQGIATAWQGDISIDDVAFTDGICEGTCRKCIYLKIINVIKRMAN